MSVFGWSYPAGCSGPPEDYYGPCEVCGQDERRCVCPECPECGAFGDPECYEKHGLARSEEQKRLFREYEEAARREAETFPDADFEAALAASVTPEDEEATAKAWPTFKERLDTLERRQKC